MSTIQHYSCHTRIVTNMAKLHGIDGDKIVYCNVPMDNGCPPSHIGDKSGFPWLPTPVAQKAVVHPAGSKSIRRNSDVSPIAVLVDHELKILFALLDHEFGAFGSLRNHVFVTRPQVLVRTEKMLIARRLRAICYAQSS